ncbi:MAG: TlpA disulfide reductase family protein [Verrucomicrobiales bacterium]|nr:TlpA disulfide reductase family protein [Verrucomicrobiales bacterium]
MRIYFCAFLALSFFVPLSVHSDDALQIATSFERRKLEALLTYLKDTPNADDEDVALRILVGSYSTLGEFEAVPDLLIRRYELLPKTGEPNLQVLFAEISRPLVEASISSDQRDKAKAFITRVKSDFSSSPVSGQLDQFLDQLGSDLYLPGVGDKMDFAFTDLEGEEIDLSGMRDKVILVDFWATWCGPCLASMPNLQAAHEKYHEKGFEIIGISLDESLPELEAFLEENKIPWPQYFDALGGENEIAQRYGIRQIPATFLVGKGGKIAAANLHGEELSEAIERELAREP